MNITIQGKVIDCYEKPIYVNKETGESTTKKFAVQLLANQKLNNGASKKELVDITIDKKLSPRSNRGTQYRNRCKNVVFGKQRLCRCR